MGTHCNVILRPEFSKVTYLFRRRQHRKQIRMMMRVENSTTEPIRMTPGFPSSLMVSPDSQCQRLCQHTHKHKFVELSHQNVEYMYIQVSLIIACFRKNVKPFPKSSKKPGADYMLHIYNFILNLSWNVFGSPRVKWGRGFNGMVLSHCAKVSFYFSHKRHIRQNSNKQWLWGGGV